MEQESFANRLAKALIIRNMKPIDLAKKSGLNKATISQYLSGRYEAKQTNIYILAKTLDINEAWLMGYDTKIDRVPDNERKQLMQYIANDNSMLPLLGLGDIAYIEPTENCSSGDTVYFRLDNKLFVRKIIINDNNYTFIPMNEVEFTVESYSEKELKEKEFVIIGKVVRVENSSAFK